MVISLLAEQPTRYSDIRHQIGPVTAKVLTAALRSLERDDFVIRMEQPGPPRSVHYGRTEQGRTLLPASSWPWSGRRTTWPRCSTHRRHTTAHSPDGTGQQWVDQELSYRITVSAAQSNTSTTVDPC